MKYISFFVDDEYYYCYSKEGKFLKGENSTSFVPDYKYFLSIIITTYIGNILNDIYKNALNRMICFCMIFISIIISLLFALYSYKKIVTDVESNLKEVYLSKTQINEYILQGKQHFKNQLLILYTLVIISIFLLVLFYYRQNFFLLLFGSILTYVSSLIFPWIDPVGKYYFFKNQANSIIAQLDQSGNGSVIDDSNK